MSNYANGLHSDSDLPDLIVIGAGQSGLATAHTALRQGWRRPLILEAGADTAGSWPSYYDSLTLFSPAGYSALPGRPFPGDADRYPTRDEVAGYLRDYAGALDAEIRTGHRVTAVRPAKATEATGPSGGLIVETAGGSTFIAPAVVAATGAFAHPHLPRLPDRDGFGGRTLHAAEYRNPKAFTGDRVIVVGAGNSAIQIAADLAPHAEVTLATRAPVRWAPQHILGRDLHWWLRRTGVDIAPIRRRLHKLPVSVIDDGGYRAALDAAGIERREMFTGFTADGVRWPDGTETPADTVLWATGYRHRYPYLSDAGHRLGVSTALPGLGFVGIEFQRSFASNSLRGAARDAAYVLRRLRRSHRSHR
jgi:putative flavoprotein involved in K+ transport